MWIWEHWKVYGESPTEVKRQFKRAFNRRYDQLPHLPSFKREYLRIKKNKGVSHLVAGHKVDPHRFSFTPECQNQEQVEAVKQHARANPSGMSIKDRSIDLDIPKTTVRTILRHNIGMKAFKIMEVQELKPHHFPARKTFSQWLVKQPAGFEHNVIWSDEKIFVLHMRLNKQGRNL